MKKLVTFHIERKGNKITNIYMEKDGKLSCNFIYPVTKESYTFFKNRTQRSAYVDEHEQLLEWID